VALAISLTGCGYVGDPLPPALHIPQTVKDLTVRQVGSSIVVNFTIPSLTTEGIAMDRVRSVDLRIGDSTGSADEWAAAAQPASPSETAPGPAQVRIPLRGWENKAVRVGVRVQSARSRWSEWSPLVALQAVDEVAAPRAVRAESHPRGVRITWENATSVRIWRKEEEAAVAKGNEWVDEQAGFGQAYEYSLESVADSGAVSERTAPVRFTPEDRFAPSVPTGLTAIAGIGSIELAWERSPEPDLTGYRLYRSDGGSWSRISELSPSPSFSDRSVKTGMSYRYCVTSVDGKGNESARSGEVEALAP